MKAQRGMFKPLIRSVPVAGDHANLEGLQRAEEIPRTRVSLEVTNHTLLIGSASLKRQSASADLSTRKESATHT